MSGISSAMSTALSGLELFEAGIDTVSNNLTNASTNGYAVESVSATEAIAGASGEGVLAPVISRATSAFAASQLRSANAQSASASLLSTNLTSISNALTDNGNVQSAMNTFFNDLSTLAADPTSGAQATTVLDDAQQVASAFQDANGSLQTAMTTATSGLGNDVATANGLLTQLATLNKSLAADPNSSSLLDQQQGALNSLSSLLGVNVTTQADGQVIVSSGGTILLDQSGAQSISLGTAADGSPALTAGTDAAALTPAADDGSLGAGLASFQAASQAQQGLNALATIFAGTVNTAQAQGLTSSGAEGQALFSVPAATATANSGNSSSASVAVSAVNSATLPSNGGPFTLTYTASGWQAANQATGQSVAVSGTPPSFAGITLAVTGTPSVGDSWTVNPAPDAAGNLEVATTNPDDIASADPYVATAGTLQANGSVTDNNAGTITAGTDSVVSTPATGAAVIPAADFGQDLQVTFTSATSYSVALASAPGTSIATGSFSATGGGTLAIAYPAGSAAAGSYWQLPISGAPATGDTLTLTPGGAGSGSNATRMAGLWTAGGTTAGGSLEQSAVNFSASLGSNAQQAQDSATNATALVTTATSNLQTVSGVNSDQQAVLLSNYQQAYQASAQVISTAHSMFESLITAVAG